MMNLNYLESLMSDLKGTDIAKVILIQVQKKQFVFVKGNKKVI